MFTLAGNEESYFHQDGWEILYRRTEGVLKMQKEMADFFQKLSEVEKKYARELKGVIQSAPGKAMKSGFLDGTVKTSWLAILNELDKVATKHNDYATQINNDVVAHINQYVRDKEATRRKLTTEGRKLYKDYKEQISLLDKTKKNYIKLSEEADKSQALLIRGQSDAAMKPSKLSQLSTKSSQASDKANAADAEYQDVLKDTNDKQDRYYATDMPNLLDEFQLFEEDRVDFTRESFMRFATFFKELPPTYESAVSTAVSTIEAIDKDADVDLFIRENKTSAAVPPAIEYEPYDMENPTGATNANTSRPAASPGPASGSSKPANSGGGISLAPKKAAVRKDWGLSPADDNLSDNDKKSKLEAQLGEITHLIASENQAKAGIEKLIQFYQADPNAQKQAEGELEEMEAKIRDLQASKELINTQLANLGGGGAANAAAANAFAFQSNKKVEEASPVVAKARALYDYDATCDTELSFKEGDILNITEKDESGWWFAELGGKSGFVPQNYISSI